jgi:hypothetical protein
MLSAVTLPALCLLCKPFVCADCTQAFQLDQNIAVMDAAIALKRFDPLTRKFCT